MKTVLLILLVFSFGNVSTVFAGEADVLSAEVKVTGKGIYRFDVTVRHNDKGWDHYADRFEVLAPDGKLLGTRILHHPHVNEQPFTRSLSAIKVPGEIKEVSIRAHDSVHAFGGKSVTINLPRN